MSPAAPPNRATAPIAPVFRGIAPAELELELPMPLPLSEIEAEPVGRAVSTEVVADGTPLVNGALEAELASLNAGSPVDAVG